MKRQFITTAAQETHVELATWNEHHVIWYFIALGLLSSGHTGFSLFVKYATAYTEGSVGAIIQTLPTPLIHFL